MIPSLVHPNPICVALDTSDIAKAKALAKAVKPHVGMMKIGMEFFYANGRAGYEAVAAEGVPIFLDLKLHDIPNTVEQGLRSLMTLVPPPAIINVHASGGRAMMEAARKAVPASTKLIAVTVLTSLESRDLFDVGFDAVGAPLVVQMAKLANNCGIDGIVCSPLELESVRKKLGADFLTVVPGIRPENSAVQDQKRIATPKAAIEAGADILVIGRAITGATDPAAAARMILESLA